MGQIITSRFGTRAVADLARVLGRHLDPLAPALVICSGPLVAVGVRRALAAQSTTGIAGIDVVTYERLIEELSRSRLAALGQHPASSLELQAALRSELADAPGRFGAVAGHRTTEDRLLRLQRELAGLPRPVMRRLQETGGLPGDALRALAGAALRLGSGRPGGACVASDVLSLALEALSDLPIGARGPIVVFLPDPVAASEGRLVASLAARQDCTVILGLTGADELDRRYLNRMAGWGLPALELPTAVEPLTTGARVLEVADPEDEVRAAVRELTAHAATGIPLARMALLYTAGDPYASLIHEHLEAAGLPFSAPGHRPLAASLAGRTLLRLIELARSGVERGAFIALASSAPLRLPDGQPVPAGHWDRLSRQAGVVDADDWQPRISRLAAHLDLEEDRLAAASLIQFVGQLAQLLRPAELPGSWSAWGAWARDLLGSLLVRGQRWPDVERLAFERIGLLLDRLSILDDLTTPLAPPDLDAFTATIRAELEAENLPGRPAGVGLVVAPLGSAVGLAFERVAVVGLVEGAFPRSTRDDSLLPDQVKALARGLLLPRSELGQFDLRAIAAVAAASEATALLTTSRGDLRSRRSGSWPRVLDFLVTERVSLASHHQGIVGHGRPASSVDLGLRSLAIHVDGGDPVYTHALASDDAALAAGLTREQQRAVPVFNRFSGQVARGMINPVERVLSPTALESYAACPRRYLFDRVLRLSQDERPERVAEITARERGTLMHRILERFISDGVTGTLPEPGQPWDADAVSHLLVLLDASVQESAELGITGGRVQTEILRRDLRNELLKFVNTDDQLRADRGSRPHAVELAFGFEPEPPAIVELADGRRLRLRGMVDRVDLTEGDGLLVIDYKGGSDRPFAKMDDDPLAGGRRLQLPLYARIVAQRLGRTGPRTALYWLTKSNKLKPIELDHALDTQLEEHIGAVLDGIAEGLFPGVPGGTLGWPRLTFENCQYCDFDRVCPTDRQREWDAVSPDPKLAKVELLLGRASSAGRTATEPTA